MISGDERRELEVVDAVGAWDAGPDPGRGRGRGTQLSARVCLSDTLILWHSIWLADKNERKNS